MSDGNFETKYNEFEIEQFDEQRFSSNTQTQKYFQSSH